MMSKEQIQATIDAIKAGKHKISHPAVKEQLITSLERRLKGFRK